MFLFHRATSLLFSTKPHSSLLFLALGAFALLGIPDTAPAQTLTFSPNPLVLSISGAGATASSAVAVTTTTPIVGSLFVTTIMTSDQTNWLCAQAGGSSFNVYIGTGCAGISSNQLSNNQTYTGQITVNANGTNGSVLTGILFVSLQVGSGSSSLMASPSSLTFSVPTGGTAAAQSVSITSNGAAVSVFNTSVFTATGQAWLSASPSMSGVSASVNVAGLSPGNYSGTITAATSAGTLTFAVYLTVGGIPNLSVSPSVLSFAYQSGTATPSSQTIALSSSATPVTVLVSASTSSGGAQWLVATPTGQLTTPTQITVNVQPQGLPSGQYSGTVQIASTDGSGGVLTIPVTLLVANGPVVSATPGSLTFTAQAGGSVASQNLAIHSTGTPLAYTVSAAVTTPAGGNWLLVPYQSGTTSGSVNVSVDPGILPPGTYSGVISISAPGSANVNLSVPVTFIVAAGPILQLSAPALSFAYQTGYAQPVGQTLTVGAAAGSVNYSVAVQTATAQAWLNVSRTSGTAPDSLVVSVNPAGLVPGTYTGTVTLTPAGAANIPQTLPVTLVVSNSALLVLSPATLSFSATAGSAGASAFQNLAITSTDGTPINYSVSSSTNNGSNWLLFNSGAGATPANLSVAANSSGLNAGTYSGVVTITAATPGIANSPQSVPATLRVISSAALAVSTSSLSFTQMVNGSAPSPQTVSLTSTGAAYGSQLSFSASVTVSTGQNWLTVSPISGSTPATLTVSVNGAVLAAGTYTGQVVISSPGVASQPVNVTLTVSGNGLNLSTNSLSFSQTVNGLAPSAQTFRVTSAGGSQLAFSASATVPQGQNWLSVSPSSGTTPATVSVSVNAAGLPVGSYTGQIAISAAGAAQQIVNVTLSVGANNGLLVSTGSLTFAQAVNGSAPSPQTLSVSSNFISQLSFSTSVTMFQGQNWLSVSPRSGVTPATLTVSVNGASLSAGTYTGQVALSVGSVTQQVVAVTLTVGAGGLLSVSPSALAFDQQVGGAAPSPQSLNVTSNFITQLPISASVVLNQGQGWLSVTPTSATTPAALAVGVNGAGMSAGTYTGRVVLSSGGATQETVTVTFTINPVTQFTGGGSMAHIAAAGNWTTTFTLVNNGASTGQARLNFFGDDGAPLPLALVMPQTSSTATAPQATVNLTLTPGSTQLVQATGSTAIATRTGWAQLLTNGDVDGFAVFQQTLTASQQEAVVPLETRDSASYVIPFDNTSNLATGIAIANLAGQGVYVTVVIRDDGGSTLQTASVLMPAHSHSSYSLAAQYPVTQNRRGTLELRTASAGQISALGLRFNPTAAFSSIPALAK